MPGIFKTIRGKLTIYFTLIFGITLIVFSTVLYNIFAGQIRNDFDLVMTAFAASISETIKENGVTPDILSEMKEMNKPGSSLYYGYIIVYNHQEGVIIKSHQVDSVNVPLNKDLLNDAINGKKGFHTGYFTPVNGLWDKDGVRMLYFPASHRGRKFALVLIAPLSSQEQMLGNLQLILFTAVPVTLLLAAFIGWIFSKKAYEPVDKLVEKSKTITAEKLYERLAVDDVDDEISRLAATLNNMIGGLEASFKTLKQFTSDASHELKTPLTIMKGEIEVALKRSRSIDEYRIVLEGSLEEVNRLQNIVESLLLISKYDNKKLVLSSEEFDLNEVVIEAVKKSQQISSKKNIKIILNINEEEDSELYIIGDKSKLQNVYLNLIDNAVKYSNENTSINITTGKDLIMKNAVVTVKDEGIGIPEEMLEDVFVRFYRVDQSRTRDEGHSIGLGLAIVRVTLEAHGGSVSVTSSLGEGSVFTTILPLSRS
jgi:two-component system, OmpR family, sensor kinase